MKQNKILGWSLSLGLLTLCTEIGVLAADHMNLEDGLPLQVEDAYPIAYRGREVQSTFGYEYTRKDEDRFIIAPQIELGVFRNTEVSIRAPFYLGEASRSGSGNIDLQAFYNFNTETIYIPALAIEAEGTIPTGKDSDGFDTSLKFVTTKSITQTGSDRLHLNVAWVHNAATLTEEREHRYRVIIGYSRRIAADWVILADFVRQQEREKREDSNMLEVGLRWQVTPRTVVSFGAGAGIGRESPHARAVAGIQKSF